ncbi:MAG: TetR/AcrR family transcriptional regulator [Candidatus Eremiobacteraeota bacterium]|nr:TetR/AcrR family transcriptional regulator [Candidatus Eremiobacteraeota bacterium]
MAVSSDKKERLIHAAMRLFYCRGFAATSLADLAEQSKVPVGNVYYYFKTKEQLGEAVIGAYRAMIDSWQALAEQAEEPVERLKIWLEQYSQMCVGLMDWGCPFGRLLVDFKQQSGALGDQAAELYRIILDWVEQQFLAYPCSPQEARRRAQTLVSRAQGLSILSVILEDKPTILQRFAELESYLTDPQ